jgi:hypothetical protein
MRNTWTEKDERGIQGQRDTKEEYKDEHRHEREIYGRREETKEEYEDGNTRKYRIQYKDEES